MEETSLQKVLEKDRVSAMTTVKSGSVRLSAKEWRAIREWFRAEEACLRDSYGEPGNREGTYRKIYAKAHPTGSALYEAAREVFGEQP